jgi:AraC-like DNA-binding protein
MKYRHKVAAFQHVGAYLVEHDIAPAELLLSHGLPATLMLNPDAWIERGVTMRLVQDIGRMTGNRQLGLDIAAEFDFANCGPWGTGILRASSLGASLEFARRNIGLIRTGARLSIEHDKDTVRVSSCFDGKLEADATQHYLCDLFTLRKLIDLAEEPVPVQVAIAGQCPDCRDDCERLGGPDLVFGAGRYELEFDRDALDLPLRPWNAARSSRVQVGTAGPAVLTGRAVYGSIARAILTERPTIANVAHDLGLNVKTLQRRLGEWGVTFEQMLDDYRRFTALRELIEGDRSVTEIAFRLGYADSAHFTRAVRRWTGKPPRLLRLEPEASAPSYASPEFLPWSSVMWASGERDAV